MIQEQRRGAWTTGEESRLRSLYPNTPIAQLVSILNRPVSAIYGKAKHLGLKRSDEFKASEHSGRLRAKNSSGVATRFKKGNTVFRDKSTSTKLRQEQSMEIKTARKANPAKPVTERPIDWPRADPVALADFDPATKTCVMNCGPHGLDPRSREERKFLCSDCEPHRPNVYEQLRESLAREAALRAELEALRAVTPKPSKT